MNASTQHALPTIRPLGMQEMVLEVSDLDRAVEFYEHVIGLRIIERWGEDRPAVWFEIGNNAALGLWSPQAAIGAIANGRGGAHVHFALRIPHGSIDIVQQRLEHLGFNVTRFEFEDGDRSVYVDDPDGNVVELMDRLVDAAAGPVDAAYL